jgi:gliding motility-associated-like protein
MVIYDRWGNKLFQSGDINTGWDGTRHGDVLQQDVYVYEINYKDTSGKNHVKTGSVNLIK